MIVECLRVPKVGELARMRRGDHPEMWFTFRVTSIGSKDFDGTRLQGRMVEVSDQGRAYYGWNVGSNAFVNWSRNHKPWEYHRLIEVPDDPV